MPEPIRSQAITNHAHRYSTLMFDTLYKAFSGAFDFQKSPEAIDYWYDIQENWIRLGKDLNQHPAVIDLVTPTERTMTFAALAKPARPKMKIAYLAHPISGDVDLNLRSLAAYIRLINMRYTDVVPFAPYYADIIALNDKEPAERVRGIENSIEILERIIPDELWICGGLISAGMFNEILIAQRLSIPVKVFLGNDPADFITRLEGPPRCVGLRCSVSSEYPGAGVCVVSSEYPGAGVCIAWPYDDKKAVSRQDTCPGGDGVLIAPDDELPADHPRFREIHGHPDLPAASDMKAAPQDWSEAFSRLTDLQKGALRKMNFPEDPRRNYQAATEVYTTKDGMSLYLKPGHPDLLPLLRPGAASLGMDFSSATTADEYPPHDLANQGRELPAPCERNPDDPNTDRPYTPEDAADDIDDLPF